MNEAVELRCQHHVDERNSKQYCDSEIVRSLRELLCTAAEHERVARLHVQFGYFFTDRRNGIAQWNPVQSRIQLNISLPVVALNIVRAVLQFQLSHIT